MLNRKKADQEEPTTEEVQPTAQPEQELFSEIPWKGTLNVYICNTCSHCTMKRDDIILHVISHYPEGERNALLEKLMKENK